MRMGKVYMRFLFGVGGGLVCALFIQSANQSSIKLCLIVHLVAV